MFGLSGEQQSVGAVYLALQFGQGDVAAPAQMLPAVEKQHQGGDGEDLLLGRGLPVAGTIHFV